MPYPPCLSNRIPVRRSRAFAAFIVVTLLWPCLAAATGKLLWSEEFDGGPAPDPSIWSYDLGANGWGNRELQDYTSDLANARVENGKLIITARKEPDGFTSARLRTEDKLTFQYGTIEARIRVPDLADGLWPAVWTLGNNFKNVGWPDCGELDIMEMGNHTAIQAGVVNRRVGSTAHWERQGSHVYYGQTLNAPTDLNNGFHVFRMEWTPDLITTYLDGEQIWAIDITPASCTDCTEFHQPHFIILNLAVGGNFTGRLVEAAISAPMPAELQVDYLRIYDNGHTQMGGTGLPAQPPGIGPIHSGSWYNPLQDGHGFSVEFGYDTKGEPLAVVYWYIYDDQGNNVVMVGTGRPDGNRVEINFLNPLGMIYGEFDPETVDREEAGVGVFEFIDRENATFSYTPSEFSRNTFGHLTDIEDLPLVKLFGVPADPAFNTSAQQ